MSKKAVMLNAVKHLYCARSPGITLAARQRCFTAFSMTA